jgi:hypothetical protein
MISRNRNLDFLIFPGFAMHVHVQARTCASSALRSLAFRMASTDMEIRSGKSAFGSATRTFSG